MPQDSFPFDPVPGFSKTHQFGRSFGDDFHAPSDDELLASYAAFTQRGVTLGGGQGVIPTGCALAQHTATKLYFVADQLATDGRQNCNGLLRDTRDTGGLGGTPAGVTFTGHTPSYAASTGIVTPTPCLGNLVIRGICNLSLVSGGDSYSLFPASAMQSGGQPPITGAGGGIGSYTGGVGIGTGIISQLQARIDQANLLFIF